MTETKKLVVLVTRGLDDELSSVAFSVAQDDLLDGVVITGSPAMHALIKEGAATLCF